MDDLKDPNCLAQNEGTDPPTKQELDQINQADEDPFDEKMLDPPTQNTSLSVENIFFGPSQNENDAGTNENIVIERIETDKKGEDQADANEDHFNEYVLDPEPMKDIKTDEGIRMLETESDEKGFFYKVETEVSPSNDSAFLFTNHNTIVSHKRDVNEKRVASKRTGDHKYKMNAAKKARKENPYKESYVERDRDREMIYPENPSTFENQEGQERRSTVMGKFQCVSKNEF
jgi:hypothetical protein